ncbi:hypothetical protein JAAARDRAFT_36117 [Jaapia argillacea MUCL 33604]|uniref:nitric oxide dioxygenase n=1 Tax=Jaapia argillacea MUCL 33604 TaxID=933084 RepID=A0A067PPD2_9AGAM|nr:hypothetical protein JAAARDRAFT_36117 [Jaapia argillacea MUCL 33604]
MSAGCQVDTIPEARPLTDAQRRLVKATGPILAMHWVTITGHFYKQMLLHHPELRPLFNQTNQKTLRQPAALAAAIYAYSASIDDLSRFKPIVERICHKHVTINVLPAQYAVVGHHLLSAIKDILGRGFTNELMDAWKAAYWQLAHICIDREAELYKEAAWVGWQSFKVEKRIKESEDITSFYFVPVDPTLSPIPVFKPGQFISVRQFMPEFNYHQCRQYSLSDSPNTGYLRISVRRDPGAETEDVDGNPVFHHRGWMSNLLHNTLKEGDTIEMTAPFGTFVLDTSSAAPIVLISAGVGQTPFISMLNSIFVDKKSAVPISKRVTWIHTTRNRGSHAFREHVRTLVNANSERLRSVVFYTDPEEDSVEGKDFDFEGRPDLVVIPEEDLFLTDPTAQYYVCGPMDFMTNMYKTLVRTGVDSSRVLMEVYGAGSVPRNV